MDDKAGMLTIVGDVGLDLVLGPLASWPAPGAEVLVDRSEMRAGFSACNAALAARHLGQPCRLVADLGDDYFAHWLADRLHGVETDLKHLSRATTLTVAFAHPDGERSFITTRGHLESVTWDSLAPRIPKAPEGAFALLTGIYLMPQVRARFAEALASLRARGYRTAFDTGCPTEGWTAAVRAEARAWLAHCDILLLNEAEITGLSGDADLEPALRQLSALMPEGAIAVAKAGWRGAVAVSGDQLYEHGAPNVSVFDTVGAGDSFNAGFLAARLAGLGVEAALGVGSATASTIIARFPREQIAPGELSHLLAAPTGGATRTSA
ncbi:carbohydrate kinase family protein [Phenylobacterium montanum]|uniref:Carbohydrate kinase family protein n=1 Tax=Phenylobacterium montanum TaxID=2823693 RepID=A0A975IUQ1_9CAUL|nr:carbohydrate kinase family protein [Caulobacter sp. S6]QUD87764.1 carbohydrate kinase family protein [Caulobacter sp. S6]